MHGFDSRITFGARPRPSGETNEVWWENIPVVDHGHWQGLWIVNSTMKRLLGIDIPTPNGLALFDTGTYRTNSESGIY